MNVSTEIPSAGSELGEGEPMSRILPGRISIALAVQLWSTLWPLNTRSSVPSVTCITKFWIANWPAGVLTLSASTAPVSPCVIRMAFRAYQASPMGTDTRYQPLATSTVNRCGWSDTCPSRSRSL